MQIKRELNNIPQIHLYTVRVLQYFLHMWLPTSSRQRLKMQALFALVALICFRLQMAQPLATSYDYDLHRGEEFADSESLVHQNRERHGTSHFRPSHSIRHKQHFGINNTESATELPTPVPNAGTTENSNFHHHLHHQHQNKHEHSKSDLQLELNNRLHRHYNSHNQQRHQEHNSMQTQRSYTRMRHKIASKPMNATTTDNNTITTTEDFKNTAGIMGLVKPTSHPTRVTTNLANTITLDEANKNMQNIYHQTVIRQQQHKQHRQNLHHNHQKVQPKSNSSEMKITMPSVNEIQHNLSANSEQFRQNEKVVALRSVGYLLSSSHIKEGTGSNVTASVSVGDSTENIAGPTSESNSGPSAADVSSERGTVYTDDETEYYDYTGDNEPNPDQHDYQHALAAADIGYDYDSGIDSDDAEWHVNAANNLKTDQHQHLRLYQEQRRQQWYQQQQKQPQNDQGEHSRVARDHHRVKSQQFHNNHLVYDAHSDDEYPDDEPYRDSSEQFSNRPGDLTFQKYRELGTMQAVQQSRDLYMQRHKSPSDLATEHINRMKVAARCNRPLPRVFHVSNDTSKTYVPSCTILHRCGEDTGCCRSMGQVCTVKTYEDVPLHFIVIQVNSSNSRRQTEIEILWLRNDTECHCINRTDLTSTPEFITRDKRSGFTFRRRRPPYFDTMNSPNQLEDRSDTEENTENYPDDVCRCPRHFNVFQQDIDLQSIQQRHEQHSHGAPTVNCFCDCANTNTPCQRLKNGEEGFAMDDRRCIADRICSAPNCHFGTYNEQMGRCPRPSRKHKRHNNGFG